MIAEIFSERPVLVTVTIVDRTMCTRSVGQIAARGDWLHPLAILGHLIGALVLVIASVGINGIRLPLIKSSRAARVAVVALALVKIALTQLHLALV